MNRGRVFISHAAADAELANAIVGEFRYVFADTVEVFCSSYPGAIAVGSDWLATIEENLFSSNAMVLLITPFSIERPWIWFEVGERWESHRRGDYAIYPLCAPEVIPRLRIPFSMMQNLSLRNPADLKRLFHTLARRFDCGRPRRLRPRNIIKRIPSYSEATGPVPEATEEFIFRLFQWLLAHRDHAW